MQPLKKILVRHVIYEEVPQVATYTIGTRIQVYSNVLYGSLILCYVGDSREPSLAASGSLL